MRRKLKRNETRGNDAQLANALKIMKMQTIKEKGGCDETNKSYVMRMSSYLCN